MTSLYITADRIGETSGGGNVTWNESQALKEFDYDCDVIDRIAMGDRVDPWGYDDLIELELNHPDGLGGYGGVAPKKKVNLIHFYAGTFSKTINWFKRNGAKCCYFAAAHSIEISRREHQRLGLPYEYKHLTDPELLKRYLAGYLAADVVVCPSKHSMDVMRGLGRTGRIEIIPHGVEIPSEPIAPAPGRFTIGYLGSYGPDKGVRYLLEAWKKLNYSDAVLLLAGRDSTSPFVQWMVNVFGGGNITMLGWQENVSDFYNQLTFYVQPSASEGFGIEVLEAMAHGRPVVCSTGAGASDCIGQWAHVPPCNSDALANKISEWKSVSRDAWQAAQIRMREEAREFSWDKIRQRYKQVWKGLINE